MEPLLRQSKLENHSNITLPVLAPLHIAILRVVGFGRAHLLVDVLVDTVLPYPFEGYIHPVWPQYPYNTPNSYFYIVRAVLEFNLREL